MGDGDGGVLVGVEWGGGGGGSREVGALPRRHPCVDTARHAAAPRRAHHPCVDAPGHAADVCQRP